MWESHGKMLENVGKSLKMEVYSWEHRTSSASEGFSSHGACLIAGG